MAEVKMKCQYLESFKLRISSKGGKILEGVFNFAPSSKKRTKSLILNLSGMLGLVIWFVFLRMGVENTF